MSKSKASPKDSKAKVECPVLAKADKDGNPSPPGAEPLGLAAGASARLREKFRKLRDELSFVDRAAVAEGMILSMLAEKNILLLGPPGTAKSMLVEVLCSRLKGGAYFHRLLTRFTAPEELFGPLRISLLKEDKYERATAHYLPKAHLAFLDEIFRGSSAILNTLLTILNEKVFYNGDKMEECPLLMAVGASNEFGEEDVAAIYDRFLLRFQLQYVHYDKVEDLLRFKVPSEGETFTLEDLENARTEVKNVTIPPSIITELAKIRYELDMSKIYPSDRRLRQCLDLLKAKAWLDEEKPMEKHLLVLENALWAKKEDCKDVTKILFEKIAPWIIEARELYENARDYYLGAVDRKNQANQTEILRQVRDDFTNHTNPIVKDLEDVLTRTPKEYRREVEEYRDKLKEMRRNLADVEG